MNIHHTLKSPVPPFNSVEVKQGSCSHTSLKFPECESLTIIADVVFKSNKSIKLDKIAEAILL